MIKCPNCNNIGVKVIDQKWGEKTAIRKYQCVCGCEFLRYYELNEATSPCIIKNKDFKKPIDKATKL